MTPNIAAADSFDIRLTSPPSNNCLTILCEPEYFDRIGWESTAQRRIHVFGDVRRTGKKTERVLVLKQVKPDYGNVVTTERKKYRVRLSHIGKVKAFNAFDTRAQLIGGELHIGLPTYFTPYQAIPFVRSPRGSGDQVNDRFYLIMTSDVEGEEPQIMDFDDKSEVKAFLHARASSQHRYKFRLLEGKEIELIESEERVRRWGIFCDR
jgi:hypothetical protein